MNNIFRVKREDTAKHPTRYYSYAQESAVAKATGAKQTKNSGATMFSKGDLLNENWLLECKTCMKDQKQFTVKEEWFDKNKQESLFMNKEYSAVIFNFGPNKPNYYIIDELTFQELLEYQNKN